MVGAGAQQQSRSGHGAKGDGCDELGVVLAAGSLKCIRPAVVEDVLALAVRFGVKRQAAFNLACATLEEKVLRLPSSARMDGLSFLQGIEKCVGDEGVVVIVLGVGAGIPVGCGDIRNGAYNLNEGLTFI